MKALDDLDRTAVKEVMYSIKRRVKEDGISDREHDIFFVAVPLS